MPPNGEVTFVTEDDSPDVRKSEDEAETIPETIIISAEESMRETSTPSGTPISGLPEDEADSQEASTKQIKKKTKKPSGNDFAVETVILTPENIQDEDKDDTDE